MAHVVLLFLVTREDAYLLDIGIEKTAQYGIAERAGATCYQKCFICEYTHISVDLEPKTIN